MTDKNDFFEEDESIKNIVAGWNEGVKGLTAVPFGSGTVGDTTTQFDEPGTFNGQR